NQNGIIITDSSDNTIGGSATESNTITNNTQVGVTVKTSSGTATGNLISQNSIFSNGTLGIDLGANGVTANDAGDGDSGANNLQNFPLLTGAFTDASSTIGVNGTLNSTASSTFRIEFFANTSGDEGQRYLGDTIAYTNASGNAS